MKLENLSSSAISVFDCENVTAWRQARSWCELKAGSCAATANVTHALNAK